jgi:ribosome-binding protein aMBF1 (putative translation factor)
VKREFQQSLDREAKQWEAAALKAFREIDAKLTLTDALKAAIEESGLTCYRIAKATGIDTANLGRFIRGELSLRLDKADKLAAYLGLRLVPDPDAVPPAPTPTNLARRALANKKAKRPARRRAN